MSEFPAKYKGQCPNGDEILPGQEVIYVDDVLTHVECVAASPGGTERPSAWEGTTQEEMGY